MNFIKSKINYPNIVLILTVIFTVVYTCILSSSEGILNAVSNGLASVACLGIMVLFLGAAFYKKIRVKTLIPMLILTLVNLVTFILSKVSVIPQSSSSAIGLLFGGLYIVMMLISSYGQVKEYFIGKNKREKKQK